MKTNDTNKKKSSAAKKLVPAVAMLTTSAVMLASATYAWFTLNKEVEVTGLQMAATTGDSLEITLGGLGVDTTATNGKSGSTPTNTSFGSVGDLGWSRAEAIDSYYSVIGKLKPASSATSLTIYKVDENEVYAGGQAVNGDATVTELTEGDMPYIKLDAQYNTEKLTNEETENNKNNYKEGYYVDIPMWIRTSNSEERNLNAYVKITDPNDKNGSDLINAVRVALVPVASTNDLAEASTTLSYTASGTLTGEATIFGLNAATYNSKVLAKAGEYAAAGVLAESPTIAKASTTFGDNSENFAADGDGKAIVKMPKADKDKYAAVLVVARVWIEGESTYCNDATANQDWNIDFHFELGDVVNSGT